MQHHAQCDAQRQCASINISMTHNINSQHHAQEKLTGEIVKHDARLTHQNLQKPRLSRDIDVFTFCCSSGGGGASVYATCFHASGHPSSSLSVVVFVGGVSSPSSRAWAECGHAGPPFGVSDFDPFQSSSWVFTILFSERLGKPRETKAQIEVSSIGRLEWWLEVRKGAGGI